MNGERPLVKPTPSELAALDGDVERILARMVAIPASQRSVLSSDKFAGPIGETVITPDRGDP